MNVATVTMAGATTESRLPSVDHWRSRPGSKAAPTYPESNDMRKTAVLGAIALMGLSPLTIASDFDKGKQVFTQEAQPSCTICHTLADAGSAGAIGPDLDELKPTMEQVVNAVTSGVGVMPAFNESLSEEQINAVAHYVATVTGGNK